MRPARHTYLTLGEARRVMEAATGGGQQERGAGRPGPAAGGVGPGVVRWQLRRDYPSACPSPTWERGRLNSAWSVQHRPFSRVGEGQDGRVMPLQFWSDRPET